jgi:hypothetical protein
MPSWAITILVSFGTLAVNIGIQFYFKFVPNVEDQRRHLKTTFFVLVDVIVLSVQGYMLYGMAQLKGPVDHRSIVDVSLATGALFMNFALVLFRRWVPWQYRVFQKYMELHGEHVHITREIVDVLKILAKDSNLSDDTMQAIRPLVYGPERKNLTEGEPK